MYRTRDGRQRRVVLERRELRARMRMGELLDQYVSDEMPRRKRASTVKLHEGPIERYIRPLLGGMAVADISRNDVDALHRRATDAQYSSGQHHGSDR